MPHLMPMIWNLNLFFVVTCLILVFVVSWLPVILSMDKLLKKNWKDFLNMF